MLTRCAPMPLLALIAALATSVHLHPLPRARLSAYVYPSISILTRLDTTPSLRTAGVMGTVTRFILTISTASTTYHVYELDVSSLAGESLSQSLLNARSISSLSISLPQRALHLSSAFHLCLFPFSHRGCSFPVLPSHRSRLIPVHRNVARSTRTETRMDATSRGSEETRVEAGAGASVRCGVRKAVASPAVCFPLHLLACSRIPANRMNPHQNELTHINTHSPFLHSRTSPSPSPSSSRFPSNTYRPPTHSSSFTLFHPLVLACPFAIPTL